MPTTRTLMTGLGIGESPRWHDSRLWFANWGQAEVVAVDIGGRSKVITKVPTSIPFSIDWLPDGTLLIVAAREAQLLRHEPGGGLVTHADLSALGSVFNEIVVDGRGNTYVNGGGFEVAAGEGFAPGVVALVDAFGSVEKVADDIAFGNGMAVTPDNSTLIVAESYANRLTAFDILADGSLANRRVWADLGPGVPDGICIDAEGAVWYADVPNQHCARVSEGGEVLMTVAADRGCFACMLGGPDGTSLFVMAAEWRGMDSLADVGLTGQVLIASAPAPGVGWP